MNRRRKESTSTVPEHRSFRLEELDALTSLIADPGHHSGGGTVAAITASLAGALSVMIGRLSANRRSNRASREEIDGVINGITGLITRLQESADADSEVLVELMTAYRERSSNESKYIETLHRAAQSTLQLGDEIHQLLLLIERLLPFATRFTVSDLGAAATISRGALTAALLTADVNVRLIQDSAVETEEVVNMARRVEELQSSGRMLAERIEARTRAALAGDSR
jgi:methenyltetrahydrofolate cyclohydrolase